MQIDWWTLGLQTINLLVLVWILARFLFRPIARIVEERQAAAARILDDAKQAREEAKAAEQQAQQAAAEAASARSGLLDDAARQAEQEKQRLLAEARQEADRLRAAATAEIEHMRQSAAAEYGRQAGRLAVDIADRLFARLPESARIKGFVEGLAAALADLPDNIRAEIGAAGAPVALKAARALTPEEAEACGKAIGEALGREVALEVTVEPGLIAGLEIAAPHAEVRNNFRADLDRIAEELSQDEAHG